MHWSPVHVISGQSAVVLRPVSATDRSTILPERFDLDSHLILWRVGAGECCDRPPTCFGLSIYWTERHKPPASSASARDVTNTHTQHISIYALGQPLLPLPLLQQQPPPQPAILRQLGVSRLIAALRQNLSGRFWSDIVFLVFLLVTFTETDRRR